MLKDSELDTLNERRSRPPVPEELPEQYAERCSRPGCSGLDVAPDTCTLAVPRNSVPGRLIEPSGACLLTQ
jgi:hypothetical protein